MNKADELDLLIKVISETTKPYINNVNFNPDNWKRRIAKAIQGAGFSFTRDTCEINSECEIERLRIENEDLMSKNSVLQKEKESFVAECAKIAHERDSIKEDMEHFKHYGEMAKEENQLLTDKVIAFEFCLRQLGGKERI